MYNTLIIIGGFIGLIVTGAAVYTVWSVKEQSSRQQDELTSQFSKDPSEQFKDVLRSWTAMDYAAIAVFVIGIMLIIADLFAVIRDRDSYPYYHYGYLFCAFIFVLVGMMFMVVRLGVILRSNKPNYLNHSELSLTAETQPTFPHENNEPDKTNETNERI